MLLHPFKQKRNFHIRPRGTSFSSFISTSIDQFPVTSTCQVERRTKLGKCWHKKYWLLYISISHRELEPLGTMQIFTVSIKIQFPYRFEYFVGVGEGLVRVGRKIKHFSSLLHKMRRKIYKKIISINLLQTAVSNPLSDVSNPQFSSLSPKPPFSAFAMAFSLKWVNNSSTEADKAHWRRRKSAAELWLLLKFVDFDFSSTYCLFKLKMCSTSSFTS